jgi:hypothetical protein
MAENVLKAYLIPRRRELADGTVLPSRGEESFLENLAVLAIVAVLAGLALASYAPLSRKFAMAEAANLMLGVRTDVVAELATRGTLPDSIVTSDISGRFFERAVWSDGEIVLDLSSRFAARFVSDADAGAPGPLSLSFRVAEGPNAGNVVFLCGLAAPPAGFSAPPMRHTTVPEPYLPHFCRD